MNKGEIDMSYYSFIACEYKLPALYSPKLHNPDGTHKYRIDSEDDFNELEIFQTETYYLDIEYYTKLPYIYHLNFVYSDARCKQLYDYLMSNCEKWKKCEVWSIYLANARSKRTFKMDIKEALENLEEIIVSLEELTEEHIKYTLYEGSTPIRLMIY